MAVVIETTLGDLTVDLFTDKRPRTCLNFLKLCKLKYYNFNLFHTVQHGFIAQTGDPSGEGTGGQSVWGILEGSDKRYFECEKMPRIKHTEPGLLSMVASQDGMVGSQFFFTLASDLNSLDAQHCVIGEVTEGHDVLRQMNETICDEGHRPYQDVRITHTVILEDPFNDPMGFATPSRSPSPSAERLQGGRIAPDEEIDETIGKTQEELVELIEEKEAKARATILEIVGDLPDAEMAPPENVLFVCKLNPVTTDDDLEIIFSRFGKVVCCEVIRDKKSGDSLQYAFIEFDNKKSCEDAYLKMDNVLIDDRRIHVDFSQSVSKIKWQGKGRGVIHLDNDSESKYNNSYKHRSDTENRNRRINRSKERDYRDHGRKDKPQRHHSDDEQNNSTSVSKDSRLRKEDAKIKLSSNEYKSDSSRNDNRHKDNSTSSHRYKEASADQRDRVSEKVRKTSPELSSVRKNHEERVHDARHSNNYRTSKIPNDRNSTSNRSPDSRRNKSPNNTRTKSPDQRRNRSPEQRRNNSTHRSPDRRNRSPRNVRNRSPEYRRNRSSNRNYNLSPDHRRNATRDYRNRSPGLDSRRDRSPGRRRDRSLDRHDVSSDRRNSNRSTENNSRTKSAFNDNIPSTSKKIDSLSNSVNEHQRRSLSEDHNRGSQAKKSYNSKDSKHELLNSGEIGTKTSRQQKSDDVIKKDIKSKKRKESSKENQESREKNESLKKKKKSSLENVKKNGHKKTSKINSAGSSSSDEEKQKPHTKNSKRKMKKKKYSSSSSDTSSSSSSSESSESSESEKKKKKIKKVIRKKKAKKQESSSSSSSSDCSSTTSSSSNTSSDSSDSGHERSRKKSKNKKSVREKLIKKKSKK